MKFPPCACVGFLLELRFSHIEKRAVLMQPIRDQDALTKEALDLEFHFLIKYSSIKIQCKTCYDLEVCNGLNVEDCHFNQVNPYQET